IVLGCRSKSEAMALMGWALCELSRWRSTRARVGPSPWPDSSFTLQSCLTGPLFTKNMCLRTPCGVCALSFRVTLKGGAPDRSNVALLDTFGRVARDLRVSLRERCTWRRAYCMPADGLDWLPSPPVLSDDEVVRLIRGA